MLKACHAGSPECWVPGAKHLARNGGRHCATHTRTITHAPKEAKKLCEKYFGTKHHGTNLHQPFTVLFS